MGVIFGQYGTHFIMYLGVSLNVPKCRCIFLLLELRLTGMLWAHSTECEGIFVWHMGHMARLGEEDQLLATFRAENRSRPH